MNFSNKTKVFESVWYKRLVACIGLHATMKLLSKYGGTTIKLPLSTVALLDRRNILITQDYLSEQYKKKDLEQRWGLSYPTILKIIKETQNDPLYRKYLE